MIGLLSLKEPGMPCVIEGAITRMRGRMRGGRPQWTMTLLLVEPLEKTNNLRLGWVIRQHKAIVLEPLTNTIEVRVFYH